MEIRLNKSSSGGEGVARFARRPAATRCRGFLLAELITATTLLGLIIAGLAVSMNGFSMVNDYQWARQRCTAAAQAQLDSITATGRPIESQECKRLWPGVEMSVDRSPGTSSWEGLELVRVTAIAQAGVRKVTVHLARYVAGPASRPSAVAESGLASRPVNEARGGQS